MPDVVAPEAHRMIAAMDGSSLDFQFTMQEFSMVGGYTEDLKNPQNCQNWEVGAYSGVGACPGQCHSQHSSPAVRNSHTTGVEPLWKVGNEATSQLSSTIKLSPLSG